MFMWWIKILFFFVDDETIDPAGRCRQGDDGGWAREDRLLWRGFREDQRGDWCQFNACKWYYLLLLVVDMPLEGDK